MAILNIIKAAREIAGGVSGLPTTIATKYATSSDTDTTEYRAIQGAVLCYSTIRPRIITASWLPTSNTYQYDLTAKVTGYNHDQYKVQEVIYPGNTDSVTYSVFPYYQNKLENSEWSVFLNPLDSNKPYLRFLNGNAPGESSTDKIFIIVGGPHTVDTSTDTITAENPGDVDAFAYLVASRLLFIASTYYTNLSDGTIDISQVDNQNKSNTYAQRSKDAMDKFKKHMEERIAPAQKSRIEWDSPWSTGGERFWLDNKLR